LDEKDNKEVQTNMKKSKKKFFSYKDIEIKKEQKEFKIT